MVRNELPSNRTAWRHRFIWTKTHLCSKQPWLALQVGHQAHRSIPHWTFEWLVIVDAHDLLTQSWPYCVFSKTLLPSIQKRPFRFQHNRGYRSRDRRVKPSFHSSRPPHYSSKRPRALHNSRSRSRKVCYGCKQEGNYLWNFPHCDRHMNPDKHFVDLSDAAAYILSYAEGEVDDSGHEVLAYFCESKMLLVGSNEDQNEEEDALHTWIFEVLEISKTIHPTVTLPSSTPIR